MATLKELSEKTGYSPATISRILTGDPLLTVTAEARQRVLEEAGRLDYAATRSRRGRTPKSLLRVGVAEMLTAEERLADPYYHYLHQELEAACGESRFSFVPLEAGADGFTPPEGETVDGVIAVGIFNRAQVASLGALTPFTVFLDSSPDELRSDSVVLNYRLGIAQALDFLTALGHRSLGFVGPAWKLDDWKEPAPEIRRRLFLELMAELGQHGPILIEAPMESAAAANAVKHFLRSGAYRPTVLLTANEEIALGTIRALRETGLDIPRDMSVVSFNDTPLSKVAEPPLTSISAHVPELARVAVQMLAQRAGKPAVRTLPQKTVVPPMLVVRESTAPPPRQRKEHGK